MKIAGYIRSACVLWGLGASLLHAKDLAAVRVGEVVGEDIVTPVALEVVDPAATAALKSSEAAKTPAIFRSCSDTNALASQFQAAFNRTRSNFISSLQDTFHQTTLDAATVASPDFGYLVTAFNIKNRDFPIPSALAVDWAAGRRGTPQENRLLHSLLQSMQRHIRPDDLPSGLGLGESLRLVPVKDLAEKLTLADTEIQGQTAPKSDLITLTQARILFRREFTGDDEQPLARALSVWLKPNCIPDAGLTQLARDHATGQLIVAEHYTAGQIIAQQGSVVDARVKAALDQLSEKLSSGSDAQPVVAVSNPGLTEVQPALTEDAPAQKAPEEIPGRPIKVPGQPVKSLLRHSWPVIGLAFVSIVSAAIFVFACIWQLISRRRRSPMPSNVSVALQTELAPQLVQAVREALVQELAVQRRDLLLVQQDAAAEVARLVHRMDELQMALQERLRAYEEQIQKLETELAARTEENQELIKLKIEMIRQQLEVESSGKRLQFN